MSSQGWIKLDRQILDCWIWTEPEPFSKRDAWIDLLLLANHRDAKTTFDGKLITIKRGQRLTSVRTLAERWSWGRTKVLNFLRILEEDKMILREADSRKTLITIVNYTKFQGGEEDDETLTRHSQDTHETLTDHKQEVKNDKKNNKETSSLTTTVKEMVIASWNSLPESIAKISRIADGSSRQKLLQKRISDYGEEKVLDAIENIRQSNFLQGGGSKGWVVTFDWFIRPENFQKVLEGNYSDRNSATKSNSMSVNEYMLGIINGEIP